MLILAFNVIKQLQRLYRLLLLFAMEGLILLEDACDPYREHEGPLVLLHCGQFERYIATSRQIPTFLPH